MPEELPKDPKKDQNNEKVDETSVSESLKKSLDLQKKIEDVSSSHARLVKKISNEEELINNTLSERLSLAEELKNSLKESENSIKNSSQVQQKNISESALKLAPQELQKAGATSEASSAKTTPAKEKPEAKETVNKKSKVEKAEKSSAQKPKPVTQEIKVKINIDSSSLEKELNLVNQIISASEKFESKKNEQIKSTLESRIKESKVNSDIVKSTEKQSQATQNVKSSITESVKQIQKESTKTTAADPQLSKILKVTITGFERGAQVQLNSTIQNAIKNIKTTEKSTSPKEVNVSKKASDTVKTKQVNEETITKAKTTNKSKVEVEEVPVVKKAKESTKPKPKAKKAKEASEKTLASKATPEPVEMSNSVKKTVSASQELNTTMKQGEVIEETMTNVSSAYLRQQIKKREEQEKINNSKKEELTVSQKTEEVVKTTDKKKKGGTKKEKSEETVTKAAATPAPTPAATPPTTPPAPKLDESKIQGPKFEDYEKGLQSAKALAETAKEIAKYEGYASENQKQNIKLLDKSIQQRESVTSAVEAAREEGRDLEDIEKSISKNVKDRVFAENRLKEIVSSSTVDVKETLSLMSEIESALQEEEEASRKIATIKRQLAIQGVTDIEQIHKATEEEERRALIATQKVETLRNSIKLDQAEYIAIQQSIKQYQQIDTSLKNQLKHQKELSDKMGIFGKSIQVIGGVLDHYGVGKFLKINDAIDAMKKKAEEGGNKLQVMMAGLGSFGKTFAKMLTDPVAILTGAIGIFTYLIKAAVEFQSKTFEIAKNLGISVKNAEGLRLQFEKAAGANGKLALTGHELVETYTKMTDQLGFMAPTQNEMVQSATLIMRRFGVTAENMDRIYVSSVKNKKSVMDTFAAVVGTGKETAARLKLQMSEKQIMEAVSKVSDTVYRNFKGNTIALASAVVEAKKMGMTLDQVNKIGDSMLNFEDSISKEMEAQLLTGKNIDLSKARQFALAGDTKNLMKEINKQVGSQAEYEKMNVIQRQSYAEALGMTREEMDKMYTDQERVNKLGNLAQLSETEQYNALVKKGKSHKEIAAIMGEQSAKSAESASVQEKLASAMTRIQEAIGAASQALMPIITRVTDWLADTHNIEKVIHKVEKGLGYVNRAFMFTLNTVKGIVSVFKPMIGFLMKQSSILKVIAGTYLAIKASQMIVRGVTAAQNVISGISLMIKKKENQTLDSTIVKSSILGTKEKINAGFSVAGAIAKVTGGSGYLGPGALIVGGIAATMLMGYLSKLGAGSSGGGSASASMPDMKDIGGSVEMKPLNQAAETNKTINNSLTRTGADVKRSSEGLNVTLVNKMDAIKGTSVLQVINDSSTYPDSSKLHLKS